MSTYRLCLALLSRGKLTATMLDVYYANGRLTGEQYTELSNLLTPGGE